MKWLYTLLLCISAVKSANILGVFPSPLYSHQSVFRPIWKELSLRGHDVTVITTDPLKENITNLKEIDLHFSYKLVYDDLGAQRMINMESNLFILMKKLEHIVTNLTKEQLMHPEMQQLINEKPKFDLVLVELHLVAYYGFAKIFNCPIIGISSMEAENIFQKSMGNYYHPILNFHFNLPISHDLTLFGRIVAILFHKFDEHKQYNENFPLGQQLARKFLKDDTIDILKIKDNMDLILNNVIPGFGRMKTNVPSIIDFNGIHIAAPKELPQDLKEHLDGAKQGAIYFSFGSSVKSFLLDKEKQEIFLTAFNELPYRVLWKFEDEPTVQLPEHVKVLKWVPQQDILRHPNVKLFISQGGIQSLEEAISSCVPILGIPFFGDQFYNIKRVEKLGIGMEVDFKKINVKDLKNDIVKLIENKTYKENLMEMSDLITNQPIKPLDKVIWWIEYVIRHKGASHLKSSLAVVNFYQYYLLDILLFLIVSYAVALICLKWTIVYFVNYTRKLKNKID